MTLLYGREVYSANGRNLNLADVPTTMLQRMDVYKTQGVDMVEGDSVGVIDARTSRPFDSKGFTANLKPRSSRCRWSCPPATQDTKTPLPTVKATTISRLWDRRSGGVHCDRASCG